MPTLYSTGNETGNRSRILEMCKFRIRFRSVHCGTITSVTRYGFCQILQPGSPSNTRFLGPPWIHMPNGNSIGPAVFAGYINVRTDRPRHAVSRLDILLMCKFRFRLVHWIDPRSTEHSYACYRVYPIHWIDNEEDVGGRESVTTDEQRVLRGHLPKINYAGTRGFWDKNVLITPKQHNIKRQKSTNHEIYVTSNK